MTTLKRALPAQLDWVVRFRGVAALWVLAYHVWFSSGGEALRFGLPFDFTFGLRSLLRAGYSGIDLFFVLSGFVIAWHYVRRGINGLTFPETVDFYQRRYFRIAPVYYLSIAVAVWLTSLGWLNRYNDSSVVVLHLLFAQNFEENAVIAIRGVYWTLPTEIFFYLLFPLLLRWVDLQRPWRFALGALAFAVAYRVFVWWMSTREGVWLQWTQAFLPGRIDQFAFGVVAACGVVIAEERRWNVSGKAVVGAMLLALGVAMWVARSAASPYGWTFFIGASLSGAAIAFMLLLMAVHFNHQRDNPRLRGMPGARLLYIIGLSSLSLYIWHTFFIDLAVHYAGRNGWSPQARNGLLLAMAPVSILFSLFTYWAIERHFIAFSKGPMRGLVSRWDGRRKVRLAAVHA